MTMIMNVIPEIQLQYLINASTVTLQVLFKCKNTSEWFLEFHNQIMPKLSCYFMEIVLLLMHLNNFA